MTTGDYCVMRTMAAMTTIVKSADLGAGPNLEPLVCVFLGGVHLSLKRLKNVGFWLFYYVCFVSDMLPSFQLDYNIVNL